MDRLGESKPQLDVFWEYFPGYHVFEKLVDEKNYSEALIRLMKTVMDYLNIVGRVLWWDPVGDFGFGCVLVDGDFGSVPTSVIVTGFEVAVFRESEQLFFG
mgnify:CR=1 FL=1